MPDSATGIYPSEGSVLLLYYMGSGGLARIRTEVARVKVGDNNCYMTRLKSFPAVAVSDH